MPLVDVVLDSLVLRLNNDVPVEHLPKLLRRYVIIIKVDPLFTPIWGPVRILGKLLPEFRFLLSEIETPGLNSDPLRLWLVVSIMVETVYAKVGH